jgi:double-stranded uracil-DNA glycosylase
MLQGLAPVVCEHTRVLVLGSFPGAKSLALQQYYAHPQNAFWRIASALLDTALVDMDYPDRLHVLRQRGLGLWDVYASCEREGSLDSAIRNAQVNDFASLKKRCPALRVIAHNGGESAKHMRVTQAVAESLQIRVVQVVKVLQLPSTSPANASWSFERKLAAWQDALQQYLP